MTKSRLINIEASSACDANCFMCPRDQVTKKGNLKPELAGLIAEKIKSIPNIYEISIAGRGEPTLNPDIAKLLEIFSFGGNLALVTTGTRANPSLIEALNRYVKYLRLSVSSLEPVLFQKVHTTLNYDKTWANIRTFIQELDKDKIIIHLVGGPVIYPGLERTIDFFRENEINNIRLFPLWNRGGSKQQDSEKEIRYNLIQKYGLIAPENDYLSKEEITDIQSGPRFCPVGDSSLCINFNGNIVGCFQDFAYHTVIGDISDPNLDIMKLFENRRKILGKMPVCKMCNSFSELVGKNAQR